MADLAPILAAAESSRRDRRACNRFVVGPARLKCLSRVNAAGCRDLAPHLLSVRDLADLAEAVGVMARLHMQAARAESRLAELLDEVAAQMGDATDLLSSAELAEEDEDVRTERQMERAA